MHSCIHCTITFDSYPELDEHRRTNHQDTVLLRFISQGGWTAKVKRQRDTCFHCPCGVFRHRDSKETRRHAKNCKLARPETRVMKTTRRLLRSSRQRHQGSPPPPQRQTSSSSSSNSSSSDGDDRSDNNEHQQREQDNHPNARMEALASAAVRSSEESSTHGMLTRRRARATTTTTTNTDSDLFQQVTSLVAVDRRSPHIRLLQSDDHHHHHREPRLLLSQRGALRFSFDVLHGHHMNRRVVSIHIALHSSMIDVLTMARIITRVCDSVPGGGSPTSIRIWRPSSFPS